MPLYMYLPVDYSVELKRVGGAQVTSDYLLLIVQFVASNTVYAHGICITLISFRIFSLRSDI